MNKRLLSLLLLVLVVMMPVNLWAQDEGGTTLKSNVYVGGDISMLPKYEEAEVEYKDSLGNTVNDVIAFFKQEGLNAMRVRLFVDPTKATDNEQKQGVCQDLNYVIALGKRIKDAGLSFLLDFHYSDTWADPGRQWTPDAWKTLDDDALAIQLYTYTKECLQQLKNAGAIPDMIQTGNEISYGMLWGVSGTTDNRCYTNSDNANWLRFFNLLGQTTKACREECPNAKIILHNERVNNISTLTDFYDRMQSANIDYDIIGLSYYPEFHGNLATLEEAISALEAKNYGKSIMLVETGYSYAWSITDGVKYDYTSTYPFTEEGQRQFTADLITMLNQHSSITGLFWWWPEDNGNKMVTSYWWNAGLYNHETGQPYAAFYELKNFVGNSPGFEQYAVLTTDSATILSQDSTGVTYGKTLTFYYDDQKATRGGMSVGPFTYETARGWSSYVQDITTVVFDDTFTNCTTLTSTALWFYRCEKLTDISGIGNLKTDNVTDMSWMFLGCSGLTTLDVSNFKTDNVTDMSSMFWGCSSLTSLDVSNFNTENVTNMSWMFEGCSGLTNLDVSNFKTDNVTDMSAMFSDCSGLTNLDVSNFKTDNVTNMESMFPGCSGLTNLNLSNFNTDNVTSMNRMFSGCSGLTSLNLSSFNTGNVKDMESMFSDCSGLTNLDVSNFKTDNVTNMSSMFLGCSGLTNLDVSNFKTDNVTNMSAMFLGCSGLTNLDVSNFNTANVMYMFDMFNGCSSLTTLDVSNFKTDNVTDMSGMFCRCTGLTSLDVSNFNTENVTNMSYMFYHCSGLTTIYAGSGWSTAAVTSGGEMFTGCTKLVGGAGTTYSENHTDYSYAHIDGGTSNPGYFTDKNAPAVAEPYAVISNGNTVLTFYYDDKKTERDGLSVGPFSNMLEKGWGDYMNMVIMNVVFDASFANCTTLTSTADWFSGCSYLTTITGIEYLNTDNVTNMNRMFYGCSHLTTLDISNFNTSNVTDMAEMFGGCSGLTTLNVSNFNTSNVTNMSAMFSNCSGLTSLDVSNFNTSNVTNMNSMFDNCSGLTSLDIRHFNTSNVTDMGAMFYGCSDLISLDLSNLNTDRVTVMKWMFTGCSGLTTIDLSKFNTSKVTEMSRMFEGCSSLTSLELNNFNTSTAIHMDKMFMGCSSLASLDLSHFETPLLIDVNSMFRDAAALTTIYVGDSWDMTYVSDGADMFTGCTNLVGGAGTTYSENHVDHTYAHIDGGTSNPGYFTDIESVRRWDFTKWSSETIANLKADAAASKTTGWSDVEKKADAEAGAEPTEAAKDNCFWLDAETTEANGVAIAELEGLVFNKSYCSSRKLAIAVNYPSTSLGDYAGGAYLWLGGKDSDCFTIPNVKNGQTITIELESHKTSEGRGITLIAGSTELDSFTTMSKASYSWTIPEDCDVVVRNTNGCHIYTITVSGEGTPTNDLEIYAVETGSTITPNQPIMATQSVVVTPGNDVEWLTNMSMGSAWVNPLDFTSNIYYPGSTTTYTFEGSMRGTNNPKDGDIEDGVSTGNGYKPYQKNYPKSGGFLTFEVQQEGSLIVPIRVFAGKPLYVTDKTGTAKKDIQFKDASGQTLALQTNPLCAVSADEDVTGFVSFNVQPGEKYYVFSVGSKARFGGYVFSKQAIDIDPATMANVIDSLDALPTTLEPYAVLTTDSATILSQDSTGVRYAQTLTFYYDGQKTARNGMDVGPFLSNDERGWNDQRESITNVVFDASFANCTTLTSTALWFSGCRNLKTIVGIENLKTDYVTNMESMFSGCSGLTNLDVTNFNTANVTNMNSMFYGCSGLTNLDVSNFNTDKVTNMRLMFRSCSGLTTLNLSNFNTANVTDMGYMFSGCSGLTTLNLSNFNTENVTNMSGMFDGCSSLTTLDVSSFNTDNVTHMSAMFWVCTGLTSLDVSNFNTENVTNMRYMFYHCSGLTTIYAGSGWSTAAVTSGGEMFTGCTKLVGGAGTTYSENHTDYTYAHIDGGTSNPGYFTDKNAPVIDATFDGRVLAVGGSTTMTDALESVGGRDEVAKTITAIVWNSTVALTNSDLQGLDNPNLLIYVNERSLAPQDRNNVVVDGLAKNVVLSDTGSGNCDFYAPQTFTAEMITYSREFKQATQVGICRGWETICLPFMVQTIAHADQGVITPFGVDTSNKHFWLRRLSTNGLVSATKIEANVPYLISMPNDEKNYAKEYILKGLVTFSAQNAVVPKTEPTALALADSSIVMMPALQSVGKSSTVWALNVGRERSQYFEGSTFERDYREVRPFEAYTIHRSDTPAPRFLPINDLMNSATGIETIGNVIMSHDNYYHIDGRTVDGKPTKKGLYITNGRKVVIK